MHLKAYFIIEHGNGNEKRVIGDQMLLNIIVISISLSIDALGIGVSYKLKGVTIPNGAKIIIGIVSSLIMWVAVLLGETVNRYLPENVCKIFGVSILVLMGVAIIRNSIFGSSEAVYDRDKSLKIEGMEAILLGIALSADSISAGIAVATLGLGSIFIPLGVGLMQMFFLYLGDFVVSKSRMLQNMNSKVCGFFSGSLLILIALIRGIS